MLAWLSVFRGWVSSHFYGYTFYLSQHWHDHSVVSCLLVFEFFLLLPPSLSLSLFLCLTSIFGGKMTSVAFNSLHFYATQWSGWTKGDIIFSGFDWPPPCSGMTSYQPLHQYIVRSCVVGVTVGRTWHWPIWLLMVNDGSIRLFVVNSPGKG